MLVVLNLFLCNLYVTGNVMHFMKLNLFELFCLNFVSYNIVRLRLIYIVLSVQLWITCVVKKKNRRWHTFYCSPPLISIPGSATVPIHLHHENATGKAGSRPAAGRENLAGTAEAAEQETRRTHLAS